MPDQQEPVCQEASDDEIPALGEPDYSVLCTECGAPMAIPNGPHHPLRGRFAQFHEPCDRCRDHYFGMPKAPQSPQEGSSEAVCAHPEFISRVDVTRLTKSEDGAVTGYTADVVINCAVCNEKFEFVGLPIGSHPAQPHVSFDQCEARLPLRPHFEVIR